MEASLRRKKCLPLVPALSCTGAPDLWKLFPVQENNSPVCRRRLRCTVTTLEFKRKPAVLHHWLQTPLLFASFKLNSCRRRPPWNAGLLGLFWILTSDGRALVLSYLHAGWWLLRQQVIINKGCHAYTLQGGVPVANSCINSYKQVRGFLEVKSIMINRVRAFNVWGYVSLI